MQYDDVTANPIWETAAILKIVLSQRVIIRLTGNFVG